MKRIRLWISIGLRRLQLWIAPDYWKCCNCGHVDWVEKEVMCWKCNNVIDRLLQPGEMIYRGD